MVENCHVEPVQKFASPEECSNLEMAYLTVRGMGCQNCAARVRNGLLLIGGVINAYVDHIAGFASVAYNPELVNIEKLIGAVAEAGNDGRHEYGAELFKLEALL
jgi:copper chaperone CopZ